MAGRHEGVTWRPARNSSFVPGDEGIAEGRRRADAGMVKKSFPLSRVYRLLEPGPVVMVTTARKGRANIMTMSWHTMIDFEPPLVGCVISNRNHTFGILKTTKECVINIPTVELAAKAVGCGNTSGRKVDKFKTFRLTPVAASRVKAPLIAECYANLECKLIDARMAARYCFFILEVIKAWIDPSRKRPRTIHHLGRGAFMVAGRTIKLPSRMK
jgi:flavin reductase (DIM6/NTAB) family NADH-FMN oxidoreductase RutF